MRVVRRAKDIVVLDAPKNYVQRCFRLRLAYLTETRRTSSADYQRHTSELKYTAR